MLNQLPANQLVNTAPFSTANTAPLGSPAKPNAFVCKIYATHVYSALQNTYAINLLFTSPENNTRAIQIVPPPPNPSAFPMPANTMSVDDFVRLYKILHPVGSRMYQTIYKSTEHHPVTLSRSDMIFIHRLSIQYSWVVPTAEHFWTLTFDKIRRSKK